jgi:hypothetical protein
MYTLLVLGAVVFGIVGMLWTPALVLAVLCCIVGVLRSGYARRGIL